MRCAANDAALQAEVLPTDRFIFDRPAAIIVGQGDTIDCRLINLSREGFRIAIDEALEVGAVVFLDVPLWPRLRARVSWAKAGVAGFVLAEPMPPAGFKMAVLSATGPDRRGNDVVI